MWIHLDPSRCDDGHRTADTHPSEIVAHDWHAIVSHAIVAHSPHNHGHDRLALMAHDHRAIVAIHWPFIGSNGPHFSREFPFKNWCSYLLFSTLDWIVKELSNFWARSWVLRDPPMFRLDCDPVRAGLITKFCRIWSNFPLEHPTSAEEESTQIHFNPCELKPYLRGNRVSSEVRSII